MGIKGFLTFLNKRQCSLDVTIHSSKQLEETLGSLDFIAFDINTNLHRICNEFTDIFNMNDTINDVRRRLCEEIRNTVVTALSIRKKYPTLDVFIGLDGASPPGKRNEQRQRRLCYGVWTDHLTAGSGFLKMVFNECFDTICHKLFSKLGEAHDCHIRYVIDTDAQPNEGEVKCLKYLKYRRNNSTTGLTAMIVTTDNDVVASSLMKNEDHIVILTSYKVQDIWKQVILCNKIIKSRLFFGDNEGTRLYGLLLFAIFGGDYLPPFLASGTRNQMEALYGFTLDIISKKETVNLNYLLTDKLTSKSFIRIVLSCFGQLSKHRRCRKVQTTTTTTTNRIEMLENFFSDLLWVYCHYTVSCAHPGRIGFLADDIENVKLFKSIPNTFFKDDQESILERVNIDTIQKMSDVDCLVMDDWENIETFRNYVLSL